MKSIVQMLIILMATAIMARTAEENVNSLQALINAAEIGAVIEVPEGIYKGPITLKEGITLIGNPEKCILDGQGKSHVVLGANDAKVIGFTIRNAIFGVRNMQNYIGVFECHFKEIKHVAIMLQRGSALICNNKFEGISHTTAIYVSNSNPLICNNEISGFNIGVHVNGEYEPFITENIFKENNTAIKVEKNSSAIIEKNLFEGNKVALTGQKLPEGNLVNINSVPEGFGPKTDSPENYTTLMDNMFLEIVSSHSGVIYELADPVSGTFNVLTDHPTASFSVMSATRDTLIKTYEAFDSLVETPIKAEKKESENTNPKVVVNNPDITEIDPGRYQLDQVYKHTKSLYKEGNVLRFKRHTNLSRIIVVAPAGYVPTSVNYPHDLEKLGNQIAIHITNIGNTYLDISWE